MIFVHVCWAETIYNSVSFTFVIFLCVYISACTQTDLRYVNYAIKTFENFWIRIIFILIEVIEYFGWFKDLLTS